MKKTLSLVFAFVLALVVVLGLASCGKDVEFNVNFVVDGEVYDTVGTSGEETIKIPTNPEKDGYNFDGWYWDNGIWQKPFTANSLLDAPLSSDMNVYTKWKHIHSAYNWIIDKDATCKEAGSKHKECTECKEVLETVSIDKLTTHTPGTAATENFFDSDCENEGSYNSVVYCSICETKLSTEAKIVGKKPHTPSDWIIDNDATCKEAGSKHKECTECKEVLETDTIEKTEEHLPVTDSRVEPTDIEDGLTEGSHCSFCGETLVPQTLIPSLIQGTDIKSQLLTVNHDTIKGSISNISETFSFLNDITVAKNASYIVALDLYCEQTIHSKTVSLEIGDNIFYILVTNGNDIKLYTVTIRRRPIYKVIFETNGGSEIESQRVEEGNLAIEPCKTIRSGYTFAGWNYDFSKPILNYLTVSANWTPNEYKITYNANGGNAVITTQKVTYNQDFFLTTANRTGYIFDGWYLNGTKFNSGKWRCTGDITLEAKWFPKEYFITYHLNGGINASTNPDKYTILTNTFSLDAPTRNGYDFIGWTYDEVKTPIKKVTLATGTINNKTFTAHWQANNYKVVLDVSGGKIDSNQITVTYDNTFLLPQPCKNGYTFNGWYNGTTKIVNGTWKIDSDITVVAKWIPKSYTIAYDANGGTVTKTRQTVVFDKPFTLYEPSRTGYTFIGWYNGENQITDGIWSVTDDISLKAKWQPNSYTIKLIANGGALAESIIKVEYDKEFYLPTPTWEGFVFLGWYNEEEKYSDTIYKSDENLTLHAMWNRSPDGLVYSLSEDQTYFKIVNYIGNCEKITIPQKYLGIPVTHIENSVFSNCDTLKSVTFSKNICYIGKGAFYSSYIEDAIFEITTGWKCYSDLYLVGSEHYYSQSSYNLSIPGIAAAKLYSSYSEYYWIRN